MCGNISFSLSHLKYTVSSLYGGLNFSSYLNHTGVHECKAGCKSTADWHPWYYIYYIYFFLIIKSLPVECPDAPFVNNRV